MKKAFAGLTLLAAATGCAPEPTEVCKHMEEVVTKESGADAAAKLNKGIGSCELTWKTKKDTEGLVKYKENASCVLAATSVDQISKCDLSSRLGG